MLTAINTNESVIGIIIAIFVAVANLAFGLFDILIILRVIASWVVAVRDVWIFRFAYAVTEPLLIPFRNWLYRYEFVRRCPLDLSFVALYISAGVAQSLLNLLDRLVR